MTNKLAVTERQISEEDFETVIVEETETGTILRTIATVHYSDFAEDFVETANSIAALTAANEKQAARIAELEKELLYSLNGGHPIHCICVKCEDKKNLVSK